MAAEEKAMEEEKIVTATKKGSAVLDQWLPDHIKMQYHVLELASLLITNIILVEYLLMLVLVRMVVT
jgi:hypothetical protein